MDKLPIELLTLIAIFACTDGGPTGCALSLVSKRIRDVTRPARFFTVCVFSDPAKIDQFLRCYEAERARATDALPRVRHLCLSLMRTGNQAGPGAGPTRMPLAPTSTQPPTTREEFLAAMQRKTQQWRSAQDSLDEQYNRVVPALIRAVAPDVRTFALVQAQWRSATVVRCPFPSLREFTVVGGDPSFLPFAFAPAGRLLYPALRRLHHILAFVGRDVDFTQWAAHAPNVTHLRVSRLGALPRITVDSLNTVIGEKDQDDYPYFPKLEHAMIEPHQAPPTPGTNAGAVATAHLVFRDFLAYLDRMADRARIRLEVMPPLADPPKPPPGMDPHHMCILRVKHEWIQRIEADGAGCWEEGKQYAQVRERAAAD